MRQAAGSGTMRSLAFLRKVRAEAPGSSPNRYAEHRPIAGLGSAGRGTDYSLVCPRRWSSSYQLTTTFRSVEGSGSDLSIRNRWPSGATS